MGIIEQVRGLVAEVAAVKAAIGGYRRIPDMRWGTITDTNTVQFPDGGTCLLTGGRRDYPNGTSVLVQIQGNDRWVVKAGSPMVEVHLVSHPDTDGPGAYPVGLTIFSIADATGTSWPNGFATIETVRESTARTVQRLTCKGASGGSGQAGDVWQRVGWDDATWQPWQHVYTSDDPTTVVLSSDFVLATTGSADVPGMSIPLTVRSTTERFRVDIACDTASNNSTGTGTAWMTINVDGTDDPRQVLLNNAGNVNTRALLSRSYWVTGLSVGSHTVKLRGACTQASGMKLRTHTTMTVALDG